MYKILVTGAKGQLGSEIQYLSPYFPYKFIFTDIEDLDITDKSQLKQFLVLNNINSVVNCAAYTAVDKAESDFETANKVNHLAVQYLAELAKELNMSLVHISTDYVFNGESFQPYTETSPCDPKGIYGSTKRAGEEAIISLNLPNSVIIRTSWVYSTFGNNFVKTMRRLGVERTEINVVNDQIGSPTCARDLAEVILNILPKISFSDTKLFHYSNEGVCSWYDFATEIMILSGYNCNINPIASSQYPTPAKRPFYSVLDKSKLKTEFKIKIPHWKVSLKQCIKDLG
jgi:dTDP-4-dehydrorhamnose reductase